MATKTRVRNTNATSVKLPQLVTTSIIDAENLANQAAAERGPRAGERWNGKAGIVVEAQNRGYLVYAVERASEFEERILDPQIRHWC